MNKPQSSVETRPISFNAEKNQKPIHCRDQATLYTSRFRKLKPLACWFKPCPGKHRDIFLLTEGNEEINGLNTKQKPAKIAK